MKYDIEVPLFLTRNQYLPLAGLLLCISYFGIYRSYVVSQLIKDTIELDEYQRSQPEVLGNRNFYSLDVRFEVYRVLPVVERPY